MKGDVVIVLISFLLLIVFVGVLLIGDFASGTQPVGKPQCMDGEDNDNDGLIDEDDPGCHSDLNANNANSYDPERRNERAEQEIKICKTDNDCLNNKDGTKCLTVYPGDFTPFCGCMTNNDCISGICGPDNKCISAINGEIKFYCSASMSLLISGKDTCSITAITTSNYCDGKSYEIKDNGNTKCSGTIIGNSTTINCDWTVTSGSYNYKLYVDDNYKTSGSVTCSKSTPTCSDGTEYGSCSSNKPLYCKDGNLINACGEAYNCGCPSGYECQADESCKLVSDCNSQCKAKANGFASGVCRGTTSSEQLWGVWQRDPGWEAYAQNYGLPQIELLAASGLNLVVLNINCQAWIDNNVVTGPASTGLPYRDHLKFLVDEASKRDIDTVFTHIGESSSENINTIRTPSNREAWITCAEEMVEYCNPYAMLPFEEPMAKSWWNNQTDKWQMTIDYNEFIIEYINRIRAIKPNMRMYVMPFPYSQDGMKIWYEDARTRYDDRGLPFDNIVYLASGYPYYPAARPGDGGWRDRLEMGRCYHQPENADGCWSN